MPSEQSNLAKAAEWLWSHRKKDMWWAPTVLTKQNPDKSAPVLSPVEAVSFFKVLEERGLVFRTGGRDYHLHEAKEREWEAFISELKGDLPKSKAKANGNSTKKEKSPDFSEPLKLAAFHITKNWDHLKAAWIPVLFIVGLSAMGGYWFAYNVVLDSKNSKIEQLESFLNVKNDRISTLQTDNDRLEKQNQELKTVVAENTTPLKKRTQILASQLFDYVKRSRSNTNSIASYDDYEDRFVNRVGKVIQELDEAGLHSDKLNQAYDSTRHYIPASLDQVEIVATELTALLKQLNGNSQ